MGYPHLADLLALVELRRKRIDPRIPQPLQLLPPVTENVRKLRFVSRLAHREREPTRERR
jgi:hypothetical protein